MLAHEFEMLDLILLVPFALFFGALALMSWVWFDWHKKDKKK